MRYPPVSPCHSLANVLPLVYFRRMSPVRCRNWRPRGRRGRIQQGGTSMTRQMTTALRRPVLLLAALAAAAMLAVGLASPAGAKGATLPPNWHVHDCTASTCVLPHAATSFFPYILGQTLDQYLADPATCPNATAQAFLPPRLEVGQPLRAGVCMT